MQAFKALSFVDKWQVRRCLLRGEAPVDPRMATAAIELAESYQRRSQSNTEQTRWLKLVFAATALAVALLGAIHGDPLGVAAFGLIALVNVGDLALNPAMRPKRVARSLEASRRLAGQGG